MQIRENNKFKVHRGVNLEPCPQAKVFTDSLAALQKLEEERLAAKEAQYQQQVKLYEQQFESLQEAEQAKIVALEDRVAQLER